MVGPVSVLNPLSSSSNRKRSPRYAVDLEARVEADGNEEQVVLHDISESGAAIMGDWTKMTNQQFLEIHVAGYGRLQGEVVRQFDGGYAIEFDDSDGAGVSEQELAKFRRRKSVV